MATTASALASSAAGRSDRRFCTTVIALQNNHRATALQHTSVSDTLDRVGDGGSMPDIPLQFRWQIAEDGYRWLESHPINASEQNRDLFLAHGRPMGAGGFRVMRYHPLAAFSGLFRVFADT